MLNNILETNSYTINKQIEINEALISPDGFVALDKANILACACLDAYYEARLIGRLVFARPFQTATKLPYS